MNIIVSLILQTSAALAQTAPPPSSLPPNDAQIAAIVKSANDADIDGGKLALKKTKSAEVKAFAEDMIKDHETSNRDLKKAMRKIEIRKEKNQTSKGIDQLNKDTAKRLKPLKDAEFDREYVNGEVAVHKMVLTTIDQDLLPHAKAKELKDYLTQTRGVIAEHLEHAKHLQESMASAAK